MNEINRRKSNFDFMTIILMLMIIVEHLLIYSGKLNHLGQLEYYLYNLIKCFCIASVNVFVIKSGYFGIIRNWRKIISIDIRTIFYTLLFLIIGILLNIHEFDVVQDVKLFLPVTTKQYWYITIYIVLCVFAPYINIFLEHLSKKQMEGFLFCGFVLFYLVATFCFIINANQIITDYGYGIVNFIYLYCFGHYIKKYYREKHSAIFYLFAFIISCLLLFVGNVFLSKVFGFYFDTFYSYNSVFCLIAAFCLFMFFKNLNIPPSKVLYSLSKRSIAVFIIHVNPIMSYYFYTNIMNVNEMSVIVLLCVLIIVPLLMYIILSGIDIVVDYLLNPIVKIVNAVAYKVVRSNR